MTTQDLTWAQTKDKLLIGLCVVIVALMTFMLRTQLELSRDFAVFVAENKRDRLDFEELKGDVRTLKAQMSEIRK